MKQLFDKDGFLVIKNFFSKDDISNIRESLENYETYSEIKKKDIVWEDELSEKFKYIQNINYYIPECNRLITKSLLSTVSKLLGEDCYFVNMEIHNKAPFIGTITPAHQDNFYFKLNPASALTAYIPIEKHYADINGGLQFLIGSNKLEVVDHTASKVRAFSSLINLDDFKEFEVFKTELEAGDIVFHHANTIHFADVNKSEFSRRSFSVRFNGVSAKESDALREKYLKNLKFNRE
jgi:ectoine hydroxylase-related dioxygenase (phytanoyl-CoA dioxygenase family)